MPRDESFDTEYNRLKSQLQEAILRDYPNAERKGCPGDDVVKYLAARPIDESLDGDPNWRHVIHCSECYREFLEFHAERRRTAAARRARIALIPVAATILVSVGAFFGIREINRLNHSPKGALVFRRQVVDLEAFAVTRSGNEVPEHKTLILGHDREELVIHLPLASMEGLYEIKIVQGAGNALVSASGQAKMENGVTILTAKMDLSRLQPGGYSMCVRRVPWAWTCLPVVIR